MIIPSIMSMDLNIEIILSIQLQILFFYSKNI